MKLSRKLGYGEGEAGSTVNLAVGFMDHGNFAAALEHLERAATICRETGLRKFGATASGNLVLVSQKVGQYAEAREHFQHSRSIFQEIGHREGEGIALVNLGLLEIQLGQTGEAQRTLNESLRMLREIEGVVAAMAEERFPGGVALLDHGVAALMAAYRAEFGGDDE